MQFVERRFKLLFKFTHFRRNNFKSFAKWQLICHFSKSTQAVTNCTHFCAFKSHAIFYSLNDSTLNFRFQSHLYKKSRILCMKHSDISICASNSFELFHWIMVSFEIHPKATEKNGCIKKADKETVHFWSASMSVKVKQV